MKKLIILLLYCFISCYSSCKPDQCDDFKKCNGPGNKTHITAYLSNTDSVLHVGDTLRYFIHIPDSLMIKSGVNKNAKVFVKNLYDSHDDNYVRFLLNSGDTVIPGSINGLYTKGYPIGSNLGIRHFAVKHGNGELPTPKYLKYRLDTRDIECYFVFDRVGRYVIMSGGYAITFITSGNKRMFLGGDIVFADAKKRTPIRPRYSQYLKHMDSSGRAFTKPKLDELDGALWYYLEVEP